MAKEYRVWIEVEEYNSETDKFTTILQLGCDDFDTEQEAKDYADKMFEIKK